VSRPRAAAGDYLAVRRALGYRLAGAGALLEQFVDFADVAGADTLTTQLALRWATLPGRSASWHASRLCVVRGFARWWQAFDPATEVPPAGLLPAGRRRATPYLYSAADSSPAKIDNTIRTLSAAGTAGGRGMIRLLHIEVNYRPLPGILARNTEDTHVQAPDSPLLTWMSAITGAASHAAACCG
jgi:hypothetical protein